uniref:Uncharacterized protein n=1 Tax=Parascaris equorum TaxID=6256 RepID=A0A914RX39_PAREQ
MRGFVLQHIALSIAEQFDFRRYGDAYVRTAERYQCGGTLPKKVGWRTWALNKPNNYYAVRPGYHNADVRVTMTHTFQGDYAMGVVVWSRVADSLGMCIYIHTRKSPSSSGCRFAYMCIQWSVFVWMCLKMA